MDAIECILTRKSIRKFRPEPVPKDLLLDVVSAAMRAPSYKNSQPWEVVIVSGGKKDELSRILVDLIETDTPIRADIPPPASWPEENAARIKDNAQKRSLALGLQPGGPDAAKKGRIANSRFYGAPHGLFLFQDSSLTAWSILDMGAFAQSLMLAANAKGLGTVPQGFLIDYSAEVKRFLGIPESKRLLLGMSIGYPDLSDKAATYVSPRCDIREIVKWVE